MFHFLFPGELKDDDNKSDKKDQSSMGNESKKSDGKDLISITFFPHHCMWCSAF